MEEGLPREEAGAEARAEEEAGARIDWSEPPRPCNPRPAAEPRTQQVGQRAVRIRAGVDGETGRVVECEAYKRSPPSRQTRARAAQYN